MHDTDFIAAYPGVLDGKFCQHLIDKFEASPNTIPGVMGTAVDKTKKDSTDINITSHPHWRQEAREIVNQTIRSLVPYVRQYPFLLVGATSFETTDPQTGQRRPITHDDIRAMNDPQIAELFLKVYRLGSINQQKYKQNVGGYHHWHSEIAPSPQDPQCEQMHRVLLWMYYLNDVEEGGETEFFYQGRKIKPKQGTFVVAPTSFTHTHKGHIPLSNDKYILTSWVLYQRAEELYR
jgi:hypothetical protein